ncbi:MAG: HypC/HybG/HupF family hydrogenase formation chaperone [bacterium]
MCLAIPMKLLEIDGVRGTVELSGMRKEIMLTLTPDVRIGDYVIIHAGYAIEILNEEEAHQTLDLLCEISEISADGTAD